jgi:protein-S-isoprenylcysteine O-methyltransferase Ste14
MTLAGLVPWWITRWRTESSSGDYAVLRFVGVLLILVGVPVLLDSFARFAIQGLGTPAPVFPTRHLVVQGLYRYVRNPMYIAVVTVVLGQAVFFGSLRLLEYCAILWLGFHLFVLAYEEPTLRATFGDEYEAFCAHVPRWIPHARPWSER